MAAGCKVALSISCLMGLGGFGRGALKFVEVQFGAKIWILDFKTNRGVVLRIWSQRCCLADGHRPQLGKQARQGDKK